MENTKHGMVTMTHAMVVMSEKVTMNDTAIEYMKCAMDELEITKHSIENRNDEMDTAKQALVSMGTMVCMKNMEETEKKDNRK